MRIALMATCLVDALFPPVARATVAVLERLGHEVVFPPRQTCCGQMHVNAGFQREAAALVAHHVEVFEEALTACDVVVAPSGSCAGAVRHQHAMVARRVDDPALAERAEVVASRTYELSELLVDVLRVTDVGAYYPHRVTYHPTCHSMRVLHVGDKPLELLRGVAGIDLVDLPDAGQCCGFGGTFALKNSAMSAAMLADKVSRIQQTGATACTAGDASCLMHIDGGLRRAGGRPGGARTVHLAEILASTRAGVFA